MHNNPTSSTPRRGKRVSFWLTGRPVSSVPRRAVVEETPAPREPGDPRALALATHGRRAAS